VCAGWRLPAGGCGLRAAKPSWRLTRRRGPCLLQVAGVAQEAVTATWWGSHALALCSAQGGVAVLRLPGFTDALGPQPASFAPGAAQQAAEAPLLQPRPTHGIPAGQQQPCSRCRAARPQGG
jgi:hypothetical protein